MSVPESLTRHEREWRALPVLHSPPVMDDGDAEFASDMAYLGDLADAIHHACVYGERIHALPTVGASIGGYNWQPWPDQAAILLAGWRAEVTA